MNKLHKVIALVIVSITLSSVPAEAQFWKKLIKKEEKKSKSKSSNAKSRPVPSKEQTAVKKRIEPEYPSSEIKEQYRIDVLLPLYLNNLVQNGKALHKRLPDYAQPSINFYEGISIAAEALKSKKGKLDLYIHDITDPAKGIDQLLSDHKLGESDLIVGFLQSPDIPAVADYAKKKQINFISALSPADAGVKDNPYFVLIQPTLTTHINQLIKVANNKFAKNPKYIFKNSSVSGEKDAYLQLREALDNDPDLTIVDCSQYTMKVDSLAKLFDSSKVNVVFVSVLEIARAEEILKTLSQLPNQYRFEIFGMPSWKSLRGLTHSGSFAELSIYYTSPFYYDTSTGTGKYVYGLYKNTYGSTPSEMVYRGYETIYWYSNLLEKYGPVFNESFSDVSSAPFTRYEIEPSWSPANDFLYLENKKLYVFHYQNGGYVIEGD